MSSAGPAVTQPPGRRRANGELVIALERANERTQSGLFWDAEALERGERVVTTCVLKSVAAQWNAAHPDLAIQRGDRVCAVNGAEAMEQQTVELRKCAIELRLRPASETAPATAENEVSAVTDKRKRKKEKKKKRKKEKK